VSVMWQIVVSFIVAFVVSMATDWPLMVTWVIIGLVWSVFFRGNNPGGVATGIGTAIANAVRATFGGVWNAILFSYVFITMMMFFVRVTGISPYWITQRLDTLGWKAWEWDAPIGLPILAFVSAVMISGFIGKKAIESSFKLAGTIYVLVAILAIVMMENPELKRETITGEGAPVIVADSVGRFSVGNQRWGKVTAWLSSWGDEKPKPIAVSTAPVQPSAVARQPRPAVKTGPHPFGENGCTTAYIDETVVAYPIGGKVITTATDGRDYPIEPGVDPVGDDRMPAQDAGWFKFCRAEGSLATRVDIRR